MPAKPIWISRFSGIEAQIQSIKSPEVGRSTVERILGLKERRAQQIMAGLPGRMVGNVALVDRQALINKLRSIANGPESAFEAERRHRVAATIEGYRRQRIEQPQVLVEAPTAIVNTRLERLPAGVTVERGRIVVEFDSAESACRRLLALAMAISNDPDLFVQTVERS